MTRHVRVSDLKENTLFLETNHTGWNQQMVFMKTEILEKLKSEGILKINCQLSLSGFREDLAEEAPPKPILVRPYHIESDDPLVAMQFYSAELQRHWEQSGFLKCSRCGRQFNIKRQSDSCVLCDQKLNETKKNKLNQ